MQLARLLTLPWLFACGCWFSADEHAQACSSDEDCAPGFYCYSDFCLQEADGARPPEEDGCPSSQVESCYDGAVDTRDVGTCQAGQRVCVDGEFTDCLGQVLPEAEICNGKDDDCDGSVDDVAIASGCDTQLLGACAEGSLVCRAGVEFCEPARESQTESCNGADDDCDGTTDEVVAAPCYPPDVAGCALDAQGAWQCTGRCTTGVSECSGGEQSCNGATASAPEECTTDEEFAQDENCDGDIDENCACTDGSTRDCYAGPAGTNGRGICRAGTQACANTVWGACTDQVVPSAETCENPGADDDCNDIADDVPGIGTPCAAAGESGVCRDGTLDCVAGEPVPECVPGAPLPEVCDGIDQDCDGDPTNGFDLTSDETCGACDVRCSSSSQTCCGATCVDPSSFDDDDENCGACGRACGAGQYCCQGECLSQATPTMAACDCLSACGSRSCCGTSCRDLQSDKQNCGACGLRCPGSERCEAGECR
jgi:hypothetical protein